jgi:hypothetical protein
MKAHERFAVLFAVLLGIPLCARPARAAPEPFQRTEARQACLHYDPLKRPFFGETHVHTAYSFDAGTIDTRNTPAEAYRHAKGEPVGLPPWANTAEPSGSPPPPLLSPLVAQYPYCMPGERCEFMATRIAQLPEGRALDWAAITDHAEQLGEGNICLFDPVKPCTSHAECPPGQECGTVLARNGESSSLMCVPVGYGSTTCSLARDELSRLRQGPIAGVVATTENGNEIPERLDFCAVTPQDTEGLRCLEQAKHVWDKIQRDAEQAYDRTSACRFTSFIAYEYTAMMLAGRCAVAPDRPCWAAADCPSGTCETSFPGSGGMDNLHRNIIFRNDDVLALPISNLEAPVGCGRGTECDRPGAPAPNYPIASPQQLLEQLRSECNAHPTEHPRCEALSIPHNSNLSGGAMFLLPESLEEAELRNEMEPLVEMIQVKGQSECRFLASSPGAWGAVDEECGFENMNFSRLNGSWIPPGDRTPANLPPLAYVRNALKSGIQFEASSGVNPFKLGFVAGLDNHQGTPGQSEEIDYARNGAHSVISFATSAEALNERFFFGLETNGGGLTVAWAEENSRDAIFHALANRETYATSGTRPIVRFFGGTRLPTTLCRRGNLAEIGYAKGVPMGGTLGPARQRRVSPRFAVNAMMDPGWPLHPGAKLQRIQIVKGWVDEATGEAKEQVYDVAGGRGGGDVDLTTCVPSDEGFEHLCTVWKDPDFDPDEHAFYYARVLENPSCRWSQYYCNARGVDCSLPLGTCAAIDPGVRGRDCRSNADCGSGVCEPPLSYTQYEYEQCCSHAVPKTIQQRAWTSPIWYDPNAERGAS